LSVSLLVEADFQFFDQIAVGRLLAVAGRLTGEWPMWGIYCHFPLHFVRDDLHKVKVAAYQMDVD
jgi:hypothetical protein